MCLCALIVFGADTYEKLVYPLAYSDIILKYSNQNRLDGYLVMAVIKTESNFIHDAHSGKAGGLMQLTDDTAEWICGKMDIKHDKIDLFEPEDNIKLGCFYLKFLIDKYDGNIDVALAAYNAGPANVDAWLKDKKYSKNGRDLDYIPFPETRDYVKKVNKQWQKYMEIYKNEEEE